MGVKKCNKKFQKKNVIRSIKKPLCSSQIHQWMVSFSGNHDKSIEKVSRSYTKQAINKANIEQVGSQIVTDTSHPRNLLNNFSIGLLKCKLRV